MENAITDFVMTGKSSFRDFANSVIADLIRIAVRASITAPLAGGMGSLFSWFGGATPGADTFENPWETLGGGRASGGPVSPGTVYPVGERGMEYFAPSVPGTIIPNIGKGNVTVNIRNEGGEKVMAKSSTASFDMSGTVIDIVLDGLNRNVHGLRTALGGA